MVAPFAYPLIWYIINSMYRGTFSFIVILTAMYCIAASAAEPVAIPTPVTPLSELLAKPTAAEPATPQPVKATLNDGSKIEFDADATVWVVTDGTRNPAPDGLMTLKDGTSFVVKSGKRVSDSDY